MCLGELSAGNNVGCPRINFSAAKREVLGLKGPASFGCGMLLCPRCRIRHECEGRPGLTVRDAFSYFIDPPEGALRWLGGIARTERGSSSSSGSGSAGFGSGG